MSVLAERPAESLMPVVIALLFVALVLGACSSSPATNPVAAPVTKPAVAPTPLPSPAPSPTEAAPTPSPTADISPTEQPPPATATPAPDTTPAPGRPAGPPQTSPDTNPAWLGRGEMTDTSVELVWAVVDGADSYTIYRFNQREVDDPEAAVPNAINRIYQGTDTSLIDTAVETGERYWYTLVAIDGDVSYQRWTQAHAVTDTEAPSAITGLTADWDQEAGAITLTWDQSSDNYFFARYAIRRAIDDEQSVYYGTGWTIDQTSFIDDRLPTGGIVTYELIATDFHDNRSAATTVAIDLNG